MRIRMSDEIGTHNFGRSGTTLNAGQNGSPSVASDGNDSAIATQAADAAGHDEIACAGSPTGASSPSSPMIYDHGWTTQQGFKVRVLWYGVPDDGRRRRWFRDILSRTPIAVSKG